MITNTITGVSTMEAKQRTILHKEDGWDPIQRFHRSLHDVALRQSTSYVSCAWPTPVPSQVV